MILLFIFVNANKVKQSKEMASYFTMTKAAIALAGVLACNYTTATRHVSAAHVV